MNQPPQRRGDPVGYAVAFALGVMLMFLLYAFVQKVTEPQPIAPVEKKPRVNATRPVRIKVPQEVRNEVRLEVSQSLAAVGITTKSQAAANSANPTKKAAAPNVAAEPGVVAVSETMLNGESTSLIALNRSEGQVHGRVLLQGTPPPEKEIPLRIMDRRCANLFTNPPTTRHYAVDETGGLADVFIYVKSGVSTNWLDYKDERPVWVRQNDCFFSPHLFGVQVRQPVVFENVSDNMMTIQVSPKNPANKTANWGLARKSSKGYRFDAPEMFVRISDSSRPWALAYACVVNHPFFAVTKEDGTFHLPLSLPPGEYELEALHRKAGSQTQKIKVRGREETVVKLDFHRSGFRNVWAIGQPLTRCRAAR